ncbi:MAG: hypothetical protein HRT65_03545 [Flavobacteriaceae bacterium]|nr:hypothetical protein [Flavobacteriaceae bacterium]
MGKILVLGIAIWFGLGHQPHLKTCCDQERKVPSEYRLFKGYVTPTEPIRTRLLVGREFEEQQATMGYKIIDNDTLYIAKLDRFPAGLLDLRKTRVQRRIFYERHIEIYP